MKILFSFFANYSSSSRLGSFILVGGILHSQQPYLTVKRVTVTVDGYPTLTPDGKTILFQSDPTGNSEVYTVNMDGTNLKQLTGFVTRTIRRYLRLESPQINYSIIQPRPDTKA